MEIYCIPQNDLFFFCNIMTLVNKNKDSELCIKTIFLCKIFYNNKEVFCEILNMLIIFLNTENVDIL